MRRRTPRVRPAALAFATLFGLADAAAQTSYQSMGRLFTTPSERMMLERQRSDNRAAAAAPATPAGPALPPVPEAAPAPPPAPQRVGGFVRRSDGRATVWVDDEARETTLPRVAPGAPLPVDLGGRNVIIKPGQSYDPSNGTIQDPR
ncbi:hypothetical protein IP91_00528 [Pseudoduganella lurida]|uniref:DUF2782 domain-containing protein n=1 Tax=Pseudoduganella lurida TaxID=1036180 RepID=A0A562RLY5_9BURK|nr:hypothetical protein [Pseudoduganella lurida]TWI69460.1 hypothetical protein IP91_00528 [Pseudoduganella lurida]